VHKVNWDALAAARVILSGVERIPLWNRQATPVSPTVPGMARSRFRKEIRFLVSKLHPETHLLKQHWLPGWFISRAALWQ